MKKYIIFLFLIIIPVISKAQREGDVDLTFGTSGYFNSSSHWSSDTLDAKNTIVQKDGKIVVSGSIRNGNGFSQGFVARIETDGKLDANFGNNGIVIFGEKGRDNFFKKDGIIIQRDGKIVVAGEYNLGNTVRVYLSRITANGKIDSTFYSSGFLRDGIKRIGLSPNRSDKVFLRRSSDNIYVGFTEIGYNSTDTSFQIVKLKFDGEFDESFGQNGALKLSLPFNIKYYAIRSFIITKSDRIILLSSYFYDVDNGLNNGEIFKYKMDGSFDRSFGTNNNGIVELPGNTVPRQIIENKDGQLIVRAEVRYDEWNYLKYDRRGMLLARHTFSDGSTSNSILNSQGLYGLTYNNFTSGRDITRYSNSCLEDRTYGTDGHVTI